MALQNMKFDEFWACEGKEVKGGESAVGNFDIKYMSCAADDNIQVPSNCKIMAAYWGPKKLGDGKDVTKTAVKMKNEKNVTKFIATQRWWGGSLFNFSTNYLIMKVAIPKARDASTFDNTPTVNITMGVFPIRVQAFNNGCKQFCDRDHTVKNVPTELQGLIHLAGPCHSNAVQMTVKAKTPTTFYVIYSTGNDHKKESPGGIDALTTELSREGWTMSSINARNMKTYSFKGRSGWPFGFVVWEQVCDQDKEVKIQTSKSLEFSILAKAAPQRRAVAAAVAAPAPAPRPVVAPAVVPAPAPAVYPATYPPAPRPALASYPVVMPAPAPVVAPVAYPGVAPVAYPQPGMGRNLYAGAMAPAPMGYPGAVPMAAPMAQPMGYPQPVMAPRPMGYPQPMMAPRPMGYPQPMGYPGAAYPRPY